MLKFFKRQNKIQEVSKKPEEAEKSKKAEKVGLFSNLVQGLKRTRSVLVDGVANVFRGHKIIDAKLLEELETQLLTADVGIFISQQIIAAIKEKLKKQEFINGEILLETVKKELETILLPCSQNLIIDPAVKPFVILLVGVNGSGKTTTIGKLAKQLQNEGKKVMLAAGDTFRAAAIDQLKVWGERNAITVIAGQPGADSAAVLFDALQAARARDMDVLIADTAGRLHTQHNLMDELKKIKRILQKIDVNVPHETLLVLDATTGQNALNQAKEFRNAIGASGICITKLDGTAKGGVIFAIAKELQLPIRFIGIGEGINDLRPFVAQDFVHALFTLSGD